jgi:alkanesulfonate monooxygenase SsuD/methylene tetrahydromethanopterin reductase-like flavin-dependent oxidoreductase (luciferase family)
MKFGLFGGAVSRATNDAASDSAAYAQFVKYVQEAEALGYHSLFVVEHHFTGMGQVSASLNFLSYLAAKTSRIRLGTGVSVLPWHNPALLAEQAATVDLLSGGRLDFGIGKGYRDYEFSGFCIPPNEAPARFEESLEVIRKAWTTNGRFSHEGKYWRFNNIVVEPTPVQRPHPPIWQGAGSDEAIRRAARGGFNLLLDQVGSIEIVLERIAVFKEACESADRRYRPDMVGVARALQIVHSDEERAAAIKTRRVVLSNVGGLARGKDAERLAKIGSMTDADIEKDDAPLLGTPAEIVARLKKLRDGGVDTILITQGPNASVDILREFATTVMPAFGGQGATIASKPMPRFRSA